MKKELIKLFVFVFILSLATWAYFKFQNSDPKPPQTANLPVSSQTLPLSPLSEIKQDESMAEGSDSKEMVPLEYISMETNVYKITYYIPKACVRSVELKGHYESIEKKQLLELFPNFQKCSAYELRLNQMPLSSWKIEEQTPHKIIFVKNFEQVRVRKTFEYRSTEHKLGLETSSKNIEYAPQMRLSFENLTNTPLQYTMALELGTTGQKDGAMGWFTREYRENFFIGYHTAEDEDREHLPFNTKEHTSLMNVQNQSFNWISTGNTYFVSSVLPHNEYYHLSAERMGLWDSELFPKNASTYSRIRYESWLSQSLLIPPSNEKSLVFDLYWGPATVQHTSIYPHRSFDHVIDFGEFLGVITWPLYYILLWIHQALSFIGLTKFAWGLAIILLTICVKLVLYPLSRMAFVSSKKMAKIQPELTRIREQLKDNPQQMQAATMKAMSSAGANPLSGCLPMLIQMPVFFGLFQLLQSTFELRQSEFFYLADLSVRDPYFIVTGVLFIFYYLQQKVLPMPTLNDQNSQKMMQYMPFIFAAFSIGFPAGLGLYMITNTVFTILQQLYMTRFIKVKD